MTLAAVDAVRFRQVLGRFCTGVTVVTAVDGGRPVGFACQAFAALSLDPPMVLFCPARTSATWRAIERSGRFCVNVLGAHQQELSQRFGRRDLGKFEGVHWAPSPAGAPVLDGALAWIDATIETVHDGGDHHVVHGRVTDLDCADGGDPPLLFYRGGYTVARDAAPAPAFDALLGWLGEDAWI
ncbi:flavin reductase family protein [Pseudonocardia sp. DSM 110487]|uniref:3-hydroxy-9,10-secoandrosta-1,3,5(10)-triene-9, 17-dione monooxygenase reductase subunit n=1 Tax=Pseudonocardia sp. DSM 110487 TaxID=2865833 RepID=UPI001C697C38|nr:3-hydroxy-9,10-secoandrosta-1,3,5(10)-triene-9,17-dione monooxygenase reductase subunit [Pseudonocardia sp. DSM 110487]QYN36878.1 flavin reductase family protein [Pseudonocardia sp. DSM 110487]